MLGVVQGWKCPPQMVDFISSLGWGANNESFGKVDYGKVDFTSSKYIILFYMLPIMVKLMDASFFFSYYIFMEDISDSHVSSILSQSLHWFFQTLLLSSLRRIRTLLGFTTKVVLCNLPGKSLYNTVRELVENALDSAESIGELPLVEITIWRDVKMRAFDDANHQTYVDLKRKSR
ncbi:unnamed protein product [Lactuca saligna]|uniref:Uncharacterized protein n=1 Tax=Lactuca saligna TaxID=75948 RepID=A0AA35ZRS4_LACSI|nr:unnamed protein product [Lactuca saligna]